MLSCAAQTLVEVPKPKHAPEGRVQYCAMLPLRCLAIASCVLQLINLLAVIAEFQNCAISLVHITCTDLLRLLPVPNHVVSVLMRHPVPSC